MSRWLAKFSPGLSTSSHDIPDTPPNVSALAGVSLKIPVKIQAGDWITWDYGGPAQVEFLHTDEDGVTWAYVSWPGCQAAVNASAVTKVETT